MSKILRFPYLVFFLLILLVSSCNDDEITIAPEQEFFNETYGEGSRQNFDIYLPEGRSSDSTKTLILIHGGAWITGSKNDLFPFYTYFKENLEGYAIANMNYTLATSSLPPYPMQTDDIGMFINHLVSSSEEYEISDEFILLGVSAGAHLAMLYSYKHDNEGLVQLVCSIVGPSNFLHPSYTETDDPETAQLVNSLQSIFGFSFEDDAQYYQEMSPINFVSVSSPPTIMFYAGEDTLVPEQQGIIMRDALINAGVPNEYYFYPDEEHTFTTATYDLVLGHFLNFLDGQVD